MASLYYYTARNKEGAFVRGSLEAPSEGAALSNLRTRSLFVTSLVDESTAPGRLASTFFIGRVPQKALVAFFRSFATLIQAGVSMKRSLQVAIDQCTEGRLREALSWVVNDIENGLSLSQAMARRPKEFPRLIVTMIKAGELGGVLDEVLERLAGVLERDRALRKRVISSLTYPAAVTCAAMGLVVFLVTSVVPMFRSLYDQMHVPVPWITSLLIGTGIALRAPAVWGSALLCACAACFASIRVRGGGLEAILERIPIAGAIARKSTVSRIARMLGTLLRSGVGLMTALDVVGEAVGSARYRRSLGSLRQALSEGSGLWEPLRLTGLYEPLLIQMVRVGEETGALDAMLLRIADYYDLDVETALNALGALLEPAMILLLGGAVGFIVAAVFIPLYTKVY